MDNTEQQEATQHSLPLAIATELARMEQNISRMDADTRGLKQIVRSTQRMRANLAAAGYDMPQLAGTEYADGMRVEATFTIDDNMKPEDTPTIISVQRPQVNYLGQMIQAAQVTVAIPQTENNTIPLCD